MAGYRVFKQGKYRMDVLGQPLMRLPKLAVLQSSRSRSYPLRRLMH